MNRIIVAKQCPDTIQRIAKCTMCEKQSGASFKFSSDEDYCALGFR
ncbi:MAG: hypothetical protein U9Q12_01180 [Patescibacteria group bacterium]|nr:hypothetical protein [Patescibacteria group bacterium]